ncbi:hemerythrin domain-containing protein [Mesobacillus maritimus]|uniref:hemerythrin domain-containing protein n=1 Tax=Mesobacillus maritimus TaxID=1643336 RepID=UPI00203D2340|nr:hemerythrin domain-containing protein [Mesobacillus maritimus]MCM3586199.1 hemerythrin domain-containing protein [Mesobacillus maritimus]MCM3667526.1 hemerythrin domain-containing protein [Mesobacillus maritimus]
MSGPSLRKLDAHQSIHEGAFMEAKSLTELLEKLIKDDKEKEATEVADALIEHWEKRIIGHADSEEEGFYPEVVKKEPELKDIIMMLTRDHNLLRMLAKEAKDRLAESGPTSKILGNFQALLLVNEIHSREEEQLLLGHDHHH